MWAGSGRVDGHGALAADRPGELRAGLAVIRAAAEVLDDLAAGLAIEQVTRRGCLGHFLQAVRAMRFHGSSPERESSVPARWLERLIQLRCFEPAVVAPLAFGAFEPAEEIVEVRMRTPRNAALAFRLTFHEGDPHGRQPLSRARRMLRAARAGASTGPGDGPNTTNALKPIHNATPVQTRVVVMMCSRENRQESLAVICANQ
nr:hypothetical protein BDOA9_0155520 [Bradyrhizobium sp. DOA9]